ncbi:MAG: hypothetical protein ACRDV4_01575 [Acidimicrobiales bacterium]
MADELTELSDVLGGDPGLCQAPEAQQIDQILGVAEIVSELPRAFPRLRCPGAFEDVGAQPG